MAAISSSSPGKTILFGEHAVVYGEPAIAVPVNQVKSHVYITAMPQNNPGEMWIEAPDIDINGSIHQLADDNPLRKTIQIVQEHLNCSHIPATRMKITSDIPIAAGLGSGASVSVSLIRALSTFLGYALSDEEVNRLAFESEKIYHGTPSGIDNTVITFNAPILYRRDHPFKVLSIKKPIDLIIADTGIKSLTSFAVAKVRNLLQESPEAYRPHIQQIGSITQKSCLLLETGDMIQLGNLMIENHRLLQKLHVSCTELDTLVDRACSSGAYGAKLCGGGLGGNMIALVNAESTEAVTSALMKAGAVHIIKTTLYTG